MRRWRDRATPPPWWPENEPWPPVRSSRDWRMHRARFVRRAGFGFGFLFLLLVIGAARVISWIAAGLPITPPRVSSVFTFLAVAIVAIGWASFTMRRLGIPLGDIVGAANRVAEGDFSARLSERGPRSLRVVARAFNSMTSRLERQEQQRRHLMADIAHELRTPLTVIQGRLEGLIDGVYPRDDARLAQVLNDTRMLARLVEDLRTLANAESGTLALHREPTDLTILAHGVVTSFADEAAARGIRVEDRAGGDVPLVDIDPLRIREVLTNLVANALHHTAAGGRVEIDIGLRGDRLAVSVTDTGAGIGETDLPKIFDRFYKGHTSRGSGLGLTISKNLVEAHGGDIRAESRIGQGTTITFTLPLSQD
jgi:signal transduction histidine kinase